MEGHFDVIDSLHNAGELQVPTFTSSPFITQSLPATTQVLQASCPPFIPQSSPVTSQVHNAQSLQRESRTPSASMLMPQLQNSSDLVSALAEAMSANRLPVPEPALFTGDPLKFKDWRLSFETLRRTQEEYSKERKTILLKKVLSWCCKENC